MKAFGYSDGAVVTHYMKLVGVIGVLGLAIGAASARGWGGCSPASIPITTSSRCSVFQADPRVYATSIGITAAAVGGGAALAVRRAAALEPATAMTPPPPPDYSKALGARMTGWRARSADADDPAADRALPVASRVHDGRSGRVRRAADRHAVLHRRDGRDDRRLLRRCEPPRRAGQLRRAALAFRVLRAAARAGRARRRTLSQRGRTAASRAPREERAG
jgi:hypothetical protein